MRVATRVGIGRSRTVQRVAGAGYGRVVILEAQGRLGVKLALATRRDTQSLELRLSVQLGVRLHERGAVVVHELVAGIRVVVEQGHGGGDDKHEKKDQAHDGVGDPENQAHHTDDQGREVENIRQEEEEDSVEEVHGANDNVERVGALVHPRAHDGGGNKRGGLNNEERNSLEGAVGLSKGNEHALDDNVEEDRHDEVVA